MKFVHTDRVEKSHITTSRGVQNLKLYQKFQALKNDQITMYICWETKIGENLFAERFEHINIHL